MGVLNKGTDFSNGDQVTDTNLDNLVDNATFTSSAVDSSTTEISGAGAIIVRDGGITSSKFATGAVGATGVIATGYTASRSVSDRFADVVNVKDFGAAGDGVTDDTAAIQSAVNTIADYDVLDFANGTYLVEGTINIASKSNIQLKNGKITRSSSGTSGTLVFVFDIDGCNDLFFGNLHFDLSNSTTVSRESCFRLNNSNHITFHQCRFDDCYYGVTNSSALSTYISVLNCEGQNTDSVESASNANKGGSSLIYGNNKMNFVIVEGCHGSKWNHLVLSGECTNWTVVNCSTDNSGDSGIYLSGSKHVVKGCAVKDAGKDCIKILQTAANDATDNIISDCITDGAGLLLSDGGVSISLESSNSTITNCSIRCLGPTTSSLATTSTTGIRLVASNCVVSNCSITGPGLVATHGESVAIKTRTSGASLQNITVSNVRIQDVRYALSIVGNATYTVDNIAFQGVFANNVDTYCYISDSNTNITKVRFDGGGVDTTSGDAMFLGYLTDGVYVRNFDFRNIDSASSCVNHRNGTIGYYIGCYEDGTANEVIEFNDGGTGRQVENSWQYTTTGSPTVTTYNFTGDRYWDTTPSAGGSPGKIVVTAGSPGTLKDMANLAS